MRPKPEQPEGTIPLPREIRAEKDVSVFEPEALHSVPADFFPEVEDEFDFLIDLAQH